MAQIQTAPASSKELKSLANSASVSTEIETDFGIWKNIGKAAPKKIGFENPLLLQLLANRGIENDIEVQRFLNPSYESLRLFGSGKKIKDIDKATELIGSVAKQKGLFVIFGDYDVDGVCAAAIMEECLLNMGATVKIVLPHRERDGYGLQVGSVPDILKAQPDLVITVDNGTHSHEAIKELSKNNLKTIVVDHHSVGETLPDATYVLNPKQKGEEADFIDLCAAGVAYRLAENLYVKFGKPDGQEKWLLDLAAVASVCDMVPLVGDNREIVHFGLKTLQNTRRPGLVWLLEKVNKDDALSSDTIGFRIGPRLNAAGRLETATQALDLVRAKNSAVAEKAGLNLERLNNDRKLKTEKVYKEALVMAKQFEDAPSLVLSDPNWQRGVCGLVAGRLAEKFNKPVFVLEESEFAVGSGRSILGFDLAQALQEISVIFEKCGGHAAAAGCTIKKEKIEEFRTKFAEMVVSKLGNRIPKREVGYELELTLKEVNLEFLDILKRLEPFGIGNQKPKVRLDNCQIKKIRPVGQEGKHLSVELVQGDFTKKAILFGRAADYSNIQISDSVSILGEIIENNWQGLRSAEIQIIDIFNE